VHRAPTDPGRNGVRGENFTRLWPEDILEAPGHDNDTDDEADDYSVKFDWGEMEATPRDCGTRH